MTSRPLTQRQRQVLDYMRTFLFVNHEPPPVWKIAEDFGWASPNAADTILKRLERAGSIHRNEIGNRMLSKAALAGAV